MRKPRHLKPGEQVRVVEPSSPFDRDLLPAGLRRLKDMGLVPVYSDRIFESSGYLAGPDAHRCAETAAAFGEEGVGAVMSARGGYGAMRILPGLERRLDRIGDKLFMGFSDLTALHAFFVTRAGLVTFLGPNVISLARADASTLARTRAVLLGEGGPETFTYAGLERLHPGRALGRVLAGNLSLLVSLLGTPWSPPLEGTILVLEDVDEPVYRVDRMLTQLSMQPGFKEIAGLAFGDMGVPKEDEELLRSLLEEYAGAAGVPAVARFPIGHGETNFPVPQAVGALLDADVGMMRVLESPYATE